jgi:hypothetical protein
VPDLGNLVVDAREPFTKRSVKSHFSEFSFSGSFAEKHLTLLNESIFHPLISIPPIIFFLFPKDSKVTSVSFSSISIGASRK